MSAKVKDFKVVKTSEMADGDMERLVDIAIDNHNNLKILEDSHIFASGLRRLGSGSNGEVFEFVGSDGYEYAVKIETHHSGIHDGKILEKLQGIEGYPKLFFYIEGTYGRNADFYIMVSQKINGFTIGKALGYGNGFESKELISKFINNVSEEVSEIFGSTVEKTNKLNIRMFDVHSENVMFNIYDGLIYIVDVGNFLLNEDVTMLDRDVDFFARNCKLDKLIKRANEIKILKQLDKIKVEEVAI